jgi:ligand-binding sensor domain-containing protein
LGSLSNDGVNWATTGANIFAALRDGDLTDVVYDNTGIAWISSRQGLIKYESGGTSIRLLNKATHPDLLSENIRALDTHGDRLALGTDQGVVVYSPSVQDQTMQWQQPSGLPAALAESSVVSVRFGADGTLYCGTADGLFIVSEDLVFQKELTISDGLASNLINDLAVRSSGKVYIATEGGLNVYNPQDETLTLVTFGAQLGGKAVFDLTVTAADQLWIRTVSGVANLE